MEKIDRTTISPFVIDFPYLVKPILDKQDEIIDNFNTCTVPCFKSAEIQELKSQIKRLEDSMKLCKEHYKKLDGA